MIFFAASRPWPDEYDLSILGCFALLTLGLPVLGYWLAIIDLRAYLRALKGVLVVVADCIPRIPEWTYYQNPLCLQVLGLQLPCDEEEVRRAYYRLAEQIHPDCGGDKHRFQLLRRHFDDALQIARATQCKS